MHFSALCRRHSFGSGKNISHNPESFRDKDTKDHEENSYITGYQLNILNPYVKCVLGSIIFAFNRTTG